MFTSRRQQLGDPLPESVADAIGNDNTDPSTIALQTTPIGTFTTPPAIIPAPSVPAYVTPYAPPPGSAFVPSATLPNVIPGASQLTNLINSISGLFTGRPAVTPMPITYPYGTVPAAPVPSSSSSTLLLLVAVGAGALLLTRKGRRA